MCRTHASSDSNCITENGIEGQQIWMSLERCSAILNQASDIIFEWDIKKDTLSFSSNWQEKFGYVPIREHVSSQIYNSGHIHEEDIIIIKDLMADILDGVSFIETELRIEDGQGKIIYCRIRVNNRYDSDGHPEKAIGIISDISREKHQRQFLIEKSRRDSLTGLLHKKASKQAVEEYLAHTDEPRGIMLILDLDNFKVVNDRYGHLCGDALITDVAAVLCRVFRKNEIISRVGGDEFLVYLPGTAGNRVDELILQLKAELINIEVSGERGMVSCSIGAAILPDHASDFNSLFRCADLALYQVKCEGKGSMVTYSHDMEKRGFPGRVLQTSLNPDIDSDKMSVCDLLGQYSFRMLYDAADIPTAIDNLLEIVGQTYDISRAYIFENSDEGQLIHNTFEWCNKTIEPLFSQKHRLWGERTLQDYYSNFDENGIFYCSDVTRSDTAAREFFTERHVCSSLQFALEDKGGCHGFVGFDECAAGTRWTKEKLESLILVSKVLSTFLLKYRLEEKLQILRGYSKREPDINN